MQTPFEAIADPTRRLLLERLRDGRLIEPDGARG